MSPTTRYEYITTGDEQFDAFCAVPESGRGPGILLFQEIFGVNDNIRQVAERLAEAGYTTLAPDMFWRMPECTGKIGAVGFCLGGGLAFAAATLSRVDGHGIDAAVCYYGSAINDMIDQVSRLDCPAAFHYGNNDPFIPAESIATVEDAVSGRSGTEFFRYEAGHAFSNWDAPSMYNEAAAELAWSRTLDFFARHLA